MESPHKGHWRGALIFPFICGWINGWANNRDAGDLRRHCAQYDITVMRMAYDICISVASKQHIDTPTTCEIMWQIHRKQKFFVTPLLANILCVVIQRVQTHNDHYNDVIMGAMASQITSLTIFYSTVYSGAYQRKLQSSASPAFVRGIHRRLVSSPHKWPVTRKMFPFDDVIMQQRLLLGDWDVCWLTKCKSRRILILNNQPLSLVI